MAGRGRKDCLSCNTEVGARSYLCSSCGYHFPSGKIRKDLLNKKKESTGPKIYNELGKGRKKCPSCNIIITGISKICPECNFDFISAKKEKDEIKDKKREDKAEIREEKRKAKEAIAKEIRDKKEEIVEEKISSEVKELLTLPMYVAPVKLSSKEQAKRILSYGAKRAKTLLALSRVHKCWSHVDWEVVEKELIKT